MIIECINCNKRFNVNSELIPSSGRTIQCGSCNHVWFFDPKKIIQKKNEESKISNIEQNKGKISKRNIIQKRQIKKLDKTESNDKKNYEITEYKAKKGLSFSKFLSYLIVLIISFVALIIVIDTFDSPLYKMYPNLELIIFNLFETLKDIQLFIKDLT